MCQKGTCIYFSRAIPNQLTGIRCGELYDSYWQC